MTESAFLTSRPIAEKLEEIEIQEGSHWHVLSAPSLAAAWQCSPAVWQLLALASRLPDPD